MRKSNPSSPSTTALGGKVWPSTGNPKRSCPRAVSLFNSMRGANSTSLPVVTWTWSAASDGSHPIATNIADRSVPRHLARADNRKPFGAGLDGSAVDLLAILVMPEHRSAANVQRLTSRWVRDQYPLGQASIYLAGSRKTSGAFRPSTMCTGAKSCSCALRKSGSRRRSVWFGPWSVTT